MRDHATPWRFVPRSPRTQAALILLVVFGLNVSGATAPVLSTLGVGSSNANNLNVTQIVSAIARGTSTANGSQSAADLVICPAPATAFRLTGVVDIGCPTPNSGAVRRRSVDHPLRRRRRGPRRARMSPEF
jgi:hypothetical protein